MIRKKNKVLTFIFAIIFGAGHMYMGFMKQGLSIMTAAVVVIAVGSWFGSGLLFLILPILWFYSFFDAINKMTLPNSVFEKQTDQYIFMPMGDNLELKYLIARYEKVIAFFLILIGSTALGGNLLGFISDQASMAGYTEISQFADSLRWNGSRLLFSLIIIIIGVRMIIGKKKELEKEEKEEEAADRKEIRDENA